MRAVIDMQRQRRAPGRYLWRPGLVLVALLASWPAYAQTGVLLSWSDGAAKSRIVAFVRAVTDRSSPDYVAPPDRIAVFDNDGTLWSEQPAYFQLLFAHDVLREKAATNPSILTSAVRRAAAAGRHGGDDGPRRAGARRNHQRFAFRHHGR